MQIFAKTLFGRTITLQVEPTTLGCELKQTICDREGIPVDQLRLRSIGGRNILDDLSLAAAGIHSGSTIHMYYALYSGPHNKPDQEYEPVQIDPLRSGNLDISRLRALNRINCEIWERISPFLEGTKFKISIFSEITFKAPKLVLTRSFYSFPMTPLTEIFYEQNIHQQSVGRKSGLPTTKNFNRFNDHLPNLDYFDLSEIIERYTQLVPEYGTPAIKIWTAALENIQTSFGEVEQRLVEIQHLEEHVELSFALREGQIEKIYKPKGNLGSQSFQFSFSAPFITMKVVKECSKLLNHFFDY